MVKTYQCSGVEVSNSLNSSTRVLVAMEILLLGSSHTTCNAIHGFILAVTSLVHLRTSQSPTTRFNSRNPERFECNREAAWRGLVPNHVPRAVVSEAAQPLDPAESRVCKHLSNTRTVQIV